MNRIIQMEVNHATGKLLADVEFNIKLDHVNIISVKSPFSKWDMLKAADAFSSLELARIGEVCRNA